MDLSTEEQQFWELLQLTRDVDEDGSIRWYNASGELHRLGGPAIIMADGSEWFYQNDKLHREDGPAIIMADGYKAYYKDNKRVPYIDVNSKSAT